jgi:hypothetical protein
LTWMISAVLASAATSKDGVDGPNGIRVPEYGS